jgi:hypothetical protein
VALHAGADSRDLRQTDLDSQLAGTDGVEHLAGRDLDVGQIAVIHGEGNRSPCSPRLGLDNVVDHDVGLRDLSRRSSPERRRLLGMRRRRHATEIGLQGRADNGTMSSMSELLPHGLFVRDHGAGGPASGCGERESVLRTSRQTSPLGRA